MTRTARSLLARCFVLAMIAGAAGVGCGGDGSEPVDEPTGALSASVCAEVARAGKVDICHATDGEAGVKELTVSQQACSTEHATHLEDFVASPETGCKLAAPRCKRAGSSCSFSRAAECCSLSCLLLPGAKKPTCG